MARYVMIYKPSNWQTAPYIMGVQDAADPVSACRQMPEAEERGGFDFVGYPADSGLDTSGMEGFIVVKAPADYVVVDGHDPAEIAAARALPWAAIVEAVHRHDR